MVLVGRLLQELHSKLFFLRLLPEAPREQDFLLCGSAHVFAERAVLSPPISSTTIFKCLNCNEKHPCEPRKRGHQRYCSKPDCRRASKAASQRQWLSRPENQDYFRGADNCERVRKWRLAHPGCRRDKLSASDSVLQEISNPQAPENEKVAPSGASNALQDLCITQPAIFVGLISVLTGHVLQDDLLATARVFQRRGQDILNRMPEICDPEPA